MANAPDDGVGRNLSRRFLEAEAYTFQDKFGRIAGTASVQNCPTSSNSIPGRGLSDKDPDVLH
jgi:hypothetical protein